MNSLTLPWVSALKGAGINGGVNKKNRRLKMASIFFLGFLTWVFLSGLCFHPHFFDCLGVHLVPWVGISSEKSAREMRIIFHHSGILLEFFLHDSGG